MTGGDFHWFDAVSSASESLEKARSFIIGGPLTETLVAVGDAMTTSAKDHISQASRSPNARERLLFAAGDLQNAFYLYDQSLVRGIRGLRQMLLPSELASTRAKTVGCATTIALIHWFVGESAENRREWLDRARDHLQAYDADQWANRVRGYFDGNVRLDLDLNELAHGYLKLEANILPPSFVRPRPLGFRSTKELLELGYTMEQLQGMKFTGADAHRWDMHPDRPRQPPAQRQT